MKYPKCLPISQMYDSRHVSGECFWNSSIEYATASFFAPSGYHEMDVAVLFTSFGSLETSSIPISLGLQRSQTQTFLF